MVTLVCCGANGNRTSDTRIFSPLLYQLSYGTIMLRLPFGGKAVQKYYLFLNLARDSKFFFEKSCYPLPVCSDLFRETQNFTPLCYRYPYSIHKVSLKENTGETNEMKAWRKLQGIHRKSRRYIESLCKAHTSPIVLRGCYGDAMGLGCSLIPRSMHIMH